MSRKIYFAPTPWATDEEILFNLKHQTPNSLGIWEDIEAVRNPKQAEFIIIQDEINDQFGVLNMFRPKNRLYFNREALSLHLKTKYPSTEFNRFSFWDGTGYLPIRWWYGTDINTSAQKYVGISKTYDELLNELPYEKSKQISCVLSNKTMNEGHKIRKVFAKKFLSKYPSIDLYGSVEFHNRVLKNNDKMEALKSYKYSLGFDNQDFIKDFFGTQLSDAFLCWTVPIFWCGTDLGKYFPSNSFIQFNARNETEIDRIIEIIQYDDYNKRLPALEEARNLILNKYNFWPTIKQLINRQ